MEPDRIVLATLYSPEMGQVFTTYRSYQDADEAEYCPSGANPAARLFWIGHLNRVQPVQVGMFDHPPAQRFHVAGHHHAVPLGNGDRSI